MVAIGSHGGHAWVDLGSVPSLRAGKDADGEGDKDRLRGRKPLALPMVKHFKVLQDDITPPARLIEPPFPGKFYKKAAPTSRRFLL